MRKSIVLVAALLGSLLTMTPAHAVVPPPSDPLTANTASAQQVALYWLRSNGAMMLQATPYAFRSTVNGARLADNPSTQPAGNQLSGMGRVFFIGADNLPHWCTGTAVQSQYHNAVLTAAHCLYDAETSALLLRNWAFVPGYSDGSAPSGLYVGKYATTVGNFRTLPDIRFDYAFANVYNGVTQVLPGKLVDRGRLGANMPTSGLVLDQGSYKTVRIFGYPAGPHPDGSTPYDGKTLQVSMATEVGFHRIGAGGIELLGADSPFTALGSPGSPWVEGYDPATRTGSVAGLTSAVSNTDGDGRYDTAVSPFFDGTTWEVFEKASNNWSGTIANWP
ncbi:trypsin-like serine peptidase [Acrocarpospora catenulata]|uniref:trypsin-like serine peptidase n=1 Tax=Acrocarpospora catenulata TaxID=2836182 RepID=UPI001BD9EEFF|nr:hypothetical protein [Acrocarpospora catenulata]